MKLAQGGGWGADRTFCSVQMPPPRPREGHWQQQQEAAWPWGEWEKAGRCTGLLRAEGLPQDPSQDPAWRMEGAGVLLQPHCSAGPAPRGVSRVPLPDRGSGEDRRTSAAGSAIPGPVIQGIMDWHCVLNRSWTHHCSINDLVNQLRLNAQARGGGPVKTPSAAPLKVLVRLPKVRATALPRKLRQGAGQLPSSVPSSSAWG